MWPKPTYVLPLPGLLVRYLEPFTSRSMSAPNLSSSNCFSWRRCHPSPSLPSLLCVSVRVHYSLWMDRNLRFGILLLLRRLATHARSSHTIRLFTLLCPSLGRFTSSSFFRRFPSIIDTKEGGKEGERGPTRNQSDRRRSGGALRTISLLRATS